jgi:Mg-chelatase subunit ChlD
MKVPETPKAIEEAVFTPEDRQGVREIKTQISKEKLIAGSPEKTLAPGPWPMLRVVMILDRSQSMTGHEEHVIQAIRGFIGALLSGPATTRSVMTLVQFADEPEICALAQPLEKVSVSYTPTGTKTALWAAMAYSLSLEKARHEPVICVVVTDGEDNASAESDRKQVTAMIQSRREWGNWTFLWLNL